MKKFTSSFLLVATLVLLTACQSNQTKETETSSTSSSTQVSSSSSQQASSETTSSSETQASSTTALVLNPVYQSVIDRYQASLGQPAEAINQDEVNSHLALLTSQAQEYRGAFYSLYDVNRDGVEELLVALDKSGEYVLIDLYTQLADGSLLRLVDNFRNLGPEIGVEVVLRPLQDGTYLFEGEGGFRIYQYKALIPGLKRISESATNPQTSAELDLKTLNWVKLTEQ